jgi:hypothetical protein
MTPPFAISVLYIDAASEEEEGNCQPYTEDCPGCDTAYFSGPHLFKLLKRVLEGLDGIPQAQRSSKPWPSHQPDPEELCAEIKAASSCAPL